MDFGCVKLEYVYRSWGGAVAVEDIAAAMPRRIVYSVRDKGREILLCLKEGPRSLKTLFESCNSRSEMVATFVAVLELCSIGSLHMERAEEHILLSYTGAESEIDSLLENIGDE